MICCEVCGHQEILELQAIQEKIRVSQASHETPALACILKTAGNDQPLLH
jgi:hypothetical protein